MQVVLLQLNQSWHSAESNYQKAEQLLEKEEGIYESLIVFPEMFPSGFSMDIATVCESAPFPTGNFFSKIAKRYKSYVIGGLAATSPDEPSKGVNLSLGYGPSGERIGCYQKLQPFSLGGESEVYEAGAEVVIWDMAGFKVCPLICYDLRFPEHFRRGIGLGAELFCVIANWPRKRDIHWRRLLQARAIENLSYVIGVNRCGADPSFEYAGRSQVWDPHGDLVADAGNAECSLVAALERSRLDQWRQDFPALRDIRS